MVKVVSGLSRILASSLAFTVLPSCNFQEVKVDTGANFGEYSSADLNYDEVNERILKPYCLTCHSADNGNRGGVNLETLANVRSMIPSLHRTTVVDKTMPPATDPALPAPAISMLDEWLSFGAPE